MHVAERWDTQHYQNRPISWCSIQLTLIVWPVSVQLDLLAFSHRLLHTLLIALWRVGLLPPITFHFQPHHWMALSFFTCSIGCVSCVCFVLVSRREGDPQTVENEEKYQNFVWNEKKERWFIESSWCREKQINIVGVSAMFNKIYGCKYTCGWNLYFCSSPLLNGNSMFLFVCVSWL